MPHVMSLISFPMSIGFMSHVDFKKRQCRPVEFRGQGPLYKQNRLGHTGKKGTGYPTIGALDGGSQRRMKTLRNCYSLSLIFACPVSPPKCSHVACRIQYKIVLNTLCRVHIIYYLYSHIARVPVARNI